MNCGTSVVVLVVCLRVKITGRCSLAGADPAVCRQETAGTGGEAEARNRKLFAGRDLRIDVGDLLEMRLETADRWRLAGLYRPGLYRR